MKAYWSRCLEKPRRLEWRVGGAPAPQASARPPSEGGSPRPRPLCPGAEPRCSSPPPTKEPECRWACPRVSAPSPRSERGGGRGRRVKVTSPRRARLCAARRAPPSEGCPRQGHWSGLPLPSPGLLLTQGSNLGLPHCADAVLSEPAGKAVANVSRTLC